MLLLLDKAITLWQSRKIRFILIQAALVILLIFTCYAVWQNLEANLNARGLSLGFEFLDDIAGFSIIMHLIDYSEQSTYLQAFWVGLLNTLLVSFLGILFATIIGVGIGVARTSQNWLISKFALFYVELIRNIPLLLQIFFWYFVVLRSAPYPQHSYHIGKIFFISNRGISLPLPVLSSYTSYSLIIAGIIFILAFSCLLFEKKICLQKGKKRTWRLSFALSLFIISFIFFGLGWISIQWQMPVLKRFNFEGGFTIPPEFLALLIALSLYTAAFIAEVVRMGIQSVPNAQNEAALSLGLTHLQTLRLVIFPQALRVILPPLTNQYLNLTKNSSLAAAIAYPDLVSVFAGTVLNQTGHAVEIIGVTMGVYLLINLSISCLILLYEHATQWRNA